MNVNHYIILGLLSQSPKTGYAIKEVIDQNFKFYWKIGYNQIYPYLKKLHDAGLVTNHAEKSSKGPEQKIYAITNEGLDLFVDWLKVEIETMPTFKNEVLVKLNFGSMTNSENMITLLQNYQTAVEKRLHTINEIRNGVNQHWRAHKNFLYWDMVMEYGIRISATEIDWCKNSMKRMERNK